MKKQLMRMRNRYAGIVGAILTLSGFLLILGTAGSSDVEAITFAQLLIQSSIGLALLGGGYYLIRNK